ncbi:MAG: MerR family transcriptional regulator [Pseudomonadota bacterium]
MNLLDIGDVRARTGLSASALRYYEERGLIEAAGRRGLRRLYTEDVVDRLGLITLAKAAGFSLEEIAALGPPQKGEPLDRDVMASRAGELRGLSKRLLAMADALEHAAACPEENHWQCAKFCRLVKLANRGAFHPPAATGARPRMSV